MGALGTIIGLGVGLWLLGLAGLVVALVWALRELALHIVGAKRIGRP